MAPALILFEDETAPLFEPVALTRSVARLRVGAWTHAERWARLFPDRELGLVVRGPLAETERATGAFGRVNGVPEQAGDTAPDDVTFVAARLGRPELGLLEAIRFLEPGSALVREGKLLAARASGDAARKLESALVEAAGTRLVPPESTPDWPRVLEGAGLRPEEAPAGTVAPPRTLVDLVHGNAAAIDDDFESFVSRSASPDPARHPGVHFVSPERIRLAEGVAILPGSVLDASGGSILVDAGARVGPGAIVRGPVAIGRDCRVNPAARVLEGTSLGPVCKAGGEVDGTIVQGWSNKQHDGFLGHSYLGCWVNLGAATDTSDLKNDYGPVRIVLAGVSLDTGSRHVGSLIGDHSKTAIHTSLNTGTVIGVSANVFGTGFPAKEIPSFTWGAGEAWSEYRIEKALQVARVVTSRRGVELGRADEAVLRAIFHETASRREDVLRAELQR